MTHPWETVADIMAMHGKFKSLPTDADIKFISDGAYSMATIGTDCGAISTTIEDVVLSVARRMKTRNATTRVGMYWRAPFGQWHLMYWYIGARRVV